MKTSLYFVEDYVDVWFDNTNRILVVKWFNLTTREHIERTGQIHLDALDNLKTRAIVLDLSVAKGLYYPSTRDYFAKRLFPATQKRGLEIAYLILPRNPLARYAVLKFTEMAKSFDLSFQEVKNMEEALKEFQKAFLQ